MKVKWENVVDTKQVYTSGIGVVEKNKPGSKYGWFATTAITHKRIGPFDTAAKAKKFLQDIHQLELDFHNALQEKAHEIEFCGVWN